MGASLRTSGSIRPIIEILVTVTASLVMVLMIAGAGYDAERIAGSDGVTNCSTPRTPSPLLPGAST